jgi:hypothetical protein
VSELQYEPMEHMEKLQWMLDTNGWGVEPVPATTDPHPRAGYSYTFGLEAMIGHPELVVFGLAPAAARGILELVVNHLKAGGQLPVSQEFVGMLDNDLRSALMEVDRAQHSDLFGTLPMIYGEQDWRVRQFVWPHRNGAMPWDADYPEELRLTQPVIGT